MTKQWLGFKEDMKNWRQGQKEKREMKHAQKQEKRARLELENQETRSSPIIHVATQAQEETLDRNPLFQILQIVLTNRMMNKKQWMKMWKRKCS